MMRASPLWLCVLLAVCAGAQTPTPHIVAAEYFVGEWVPNVDAIDPGEGLATPIPAADGAYDGITESIAPVMLDTTGWDVGYYKVCVRFQKSDGTWGYPLCREVGVRGSNTIVACEYYIDADPGEGHGTPVPCDGGCGGTAERLSLTIPDTSNLSVGLHTLYVRCLDTNDDWGPARRYRLEISAPLRIVQAEYFLDEPNPTPGTGIPMAAADGYFENPVEALVAGIDTAGWSTGMHHTVYVHAQDTLGRWSSRHGWGDGNRTVINRCPIIESSTPETTIVDMPGLDHFDFGVDVIDDDGDTLNIEWWVDGEWSYFVGPSFTYWSWGGDDGSHLVEARINDFEPEEPCYLVRAWQLHVGGEWPTFTPVPTVTPIPHEPDVDRDGVSDVAEAWPCEPSRSTRWLPDSDGDGLDDGWEDWNANGTRDAGETSTRNRDSDGDGVDDGVEALVYFTDPLDPLYPKDRTDADRDGLPAMWDPNEANRDSDGDRYTDGYEAGLNGLATAGLPDVHPGLGDVNQDLLISNVDALMIQSVFLALIPPTHPAVRALGQSDVNRDGCVSNLDALIINTFFLGLIPHLPI